MLVGPILPQISCAVVLPGTRRVPGQIRVPIADPFFLLNSPPCWHGRPHFRPLQCYYASPRITGRAAGPRDGLRWNPHQCASQQSFRWPSHSEPVTAKLCGRPHLFFFVRLLWSATTTASSQRGLGRRIRLATWLPRTELPDRKWCKWYKHDGEHRRKDEAKQHERSGTFWCYAGWVVGKQRNGCCPTWLTAQAGVTGLRSKVLRRNLSRQGLAPTCVREGEQPSC